ncbi:hypothetical protein QR680_017955 [Steinernema hermaphroditum]|uniref:AIG1-type G domain-containing protein n=1 Tax=Steinernema hermaphroditum TaxID=289476 RepID=A0AA39LQ14_9BILA|nr:hypothetical protein QR680_017955 [Steinernema hermaphroditum]
MVSEEDRFAIISLQKRETPNPETSKANCLVNKYSESSNVSKILEGSKTRIRIRIIDIPGIPDTRGVFQDCLNFELVKQAFTHYDYINAVCFVLPLNAARLENSLKYCISEVFANIDSRLAKNILFCFTKCRETIETRFLFDNESISYLCAKIGHVDIEETRKHYEESYRSSQ